MKRVCPVALQAARAPDALALDVDDGARWSWRALELHVRRAQAALSARGVRAGERVAILSWNSVELVAALFALGRLGACAVLLNARLRSTELQALLAQAGTTRCFVANGLSAALEGEPLAGLFTAEQPPEGEGAEVDAEQPWCGLFTSGTTGTPKLIELSHANFTASAEASARNLGASPDDRWLLTLPLFHVGGLAMLYRCAHDGAGLLLERSFDAARLALRLGAGEVSHLSVVPTMLERLLGELTEPVRGVKAVLVGGGPCRPDVLARARALGLPVLQTYGLTEACSQVTTESPAEADGSTAGRPLSGVEVRIAREDGADALVGEVGEIQVRGATVAKALGPWLQTKDLGALDERGRLTVYARRVDLILSGGENVYPVEVERVLASHPSVGDVCVVPVADERWGQAPAAVVVPRGAAPTLEVLQRHAQAFLASFKLPKRLLVVEELPRTASGKVDRRAVLQLFGGAVAGDTRL